MAKKMTRRIGKKVKTLRARKASPKQAKTVKGGVDRAPVGQYHFENAWPSKLS